MNECINEKEKERKERTKKMGNKIYGMKKKLLHSLS